MLPVGPRGRPARQGYAWRDTTALLCLSPPHSNSIWAVKTVAPSEFDFVWKSSRSFHSEELHPESGTDANLIETRPQWSRRIGFNNRLQIFVLLLTFLLGLSLVAQGQARDGRKLANQTVNYGFVSPNTRDDLKLDEAIKNLRSAEEVRLIQETRHLACRLRANLRLNRSVGNWADGAENAVIFRLRSDDSTMRYAAASLGKSWHQKKVLYFRRQVGGSARLYLISLRQRGRGFGFVVRAGAKTLDDAGILYRTLVLLKTRVLVYIADLSNDLQPQVQKAAQQLHSRSRSFTGTGAFIGDDNDRDRAQEVFAQEIKSFESNHSPGNRCRNAKTRGRHLQRSGSFTQNNIGITQTP